MSVNKNKQMISNTNFSSYKTSNSVACRAYRITSLKVCKPRRIGEDGARVPRNRSFLGLSSLKRFVRECGLPPRDGYLLSGSHEREWWTSRNVHLRRRRRADVSAPDLTQRGTAAQLSAVYHPHDATSQSRILGQASRKQKVLTTPEKCSFFGNQPSNRIDCWCIQRRSKGLSSIKYADWTLHVDC